MPHTIRDQVALGDGLWNRYRENLVIKKITAQCPKGHQHQVTWACPPNIGTRNTIFFRTNWIIIIFIHRFNVLHKWHQSLRISVIVRLPFSYFYNSSRLCLEVRDKARNQLPQIIHSSEVVGAFQTPAENGMQSGFTSDLVDISLIHLISTSLLHATAHIIFKKQPVSVSFTSSGCRIRTYGIQVLITWSPVYCLLFPVSGYP